MYTKDGGKRPCSKIICIALNQAMRTLYVTTCVLYDGLLAVLRRQILYRSFADGNKKVVSILLPILNMTKNRKYVSRLLSGGGYFNHSLLNDSSVEAGIG